VCRLTPESIKKITLVHDCVIAPEARNKVREGTNLGGNARDRT
jgi:hypothetical protein